MSIITEDTRPKEYQYYRQLMDHLDHDEHVFFNGRFVWPKQFEIHLPSDHIKACNLSCPHCAGKLFDKSLGRWENDALELLDKLEGAIPYHIYGGAYTEPLMNPYFMAFMGMTKKHGNHFGIHTNGTQLKLLDDSTGFLTELNALATDSEDYLSISLDASAPWSWARTKGTKKTDMFWDIIEAVHRAVEIREKKGGGHAIRLCYLVSHDSDSQEEFDLMVSLAKYLNCDSLRFSIPFANYNQAFDDVREYKDGRELVDDPTYRDRLAHHLSSSQDERPYIFYTGPEFTDIDRFTFNYCAYGYFQITYGADGYVYRCSTTATPTGKQCRLGRVTSDLDTFKDMIAMNQDPQWNPHRHCFKHGLRGNRMAMEINSGVQEIMNERNHG